MVVVEKSFPRGGTTVKESADKKIFKEKIVFGATQKKTKKTRSKPKDVEVGNDSSTPAAFSAELLNYDTIQEGMQLMGMVKSVDQLHLTISLPGRIIARTSVLEISESYTKVTKQFLADPKTVENYKPLTDLYEVGQIVYGRVLEIVHRNNGRRPYINLTFKPESVHNDLTHAGVKRGFIFNGAVAEVQEHGYIIESGITGLRTFMPLEKRKREHVVGELIFLKVEKITPDKAASTCVCKEVNVDKVKVKDFAEPNIDYILPSTIVQFEITKVLKDGLQGTLMNGSFIGYVNEHQLNEPLALPEDFQVNQTHKARILYVMPLTKLVYLTLNLRSTSALKTDTNDDGAESSEPAQLNLDLKRGDVVEKAKVLRMGTGGVILVLKNKFKGIISYSSIKANYTGNYDQDELLSKYAKKSKHTVRIIDYDMMDSMYICTDDSKIVEEKFFDFKDLQPGEFVTATVMQRNNKIDGYTMQLGKIKGIIEKLFLAPSTKQLDENSKVRCRIIGINAERRVVYLTNRSEYMSKSCKVLTSLADAKANTIFTGTIVNCGTKDGFILVRFFNDLKGKLYKTRLNDVLATEVQNYYVGQTMPFRIQQRNNDQLVLTLPDDIFNIGEICPVTITNTLESGLEIKINCQSNSTNNNSNDDDTETVELNGLIPIRMLSDYIDLLHAKMRMYPVQSEIEAVCMLRNIFSVRDVPFFRENETKDWTSVQAGDVVKAYVKNLNGDIVDLWLPIRGYGKLVKVHLKMLLINTHENAHVTLTPEQIVYAKIISKEPITKTLTVSAKLTDVWSGELSITSTLVEQYLAEVAGIRAAFKKQGKPIAKYAIGDKIKAAFQCVQSESGGDWCYEVSKTKIPLIVKASTVGKAKAPKVGAEQECIILWIDYSNELLIASNRISDLSHFSTSPQLPANLVGKSGINAKVLLKLDNVFICSLKKGQNPLVYCPIRLHYNDFENSSSMHIKEGDFCRLTFVHKAKPIAVLDSTWKFWHDAKRKRKAQEELEALSKTKKLKKDLMAKKDREINEEAKDVKRTSIEKSKEKLKRKLENTTDSEAMSQMFYEDKTPDKKHVSGIVQTTSSTEKYIESKPVVQHLSGINDFWTANLTKLSSNTANDSSEEEEAEDDVSENEEGVSVRKKKRLTAVEKFKQQREEEERLRAIEAKYADPNQLPETVDQFDRLVMSEPNDSKNWINYMVFHLQSTEIEKARAVARRAIKTITFRNSDDLLNIWIALLNLELRYGSKETYDETLKEALTYNDPLKVYLRIVEVLSDANRQEELVELVGNLTKKFKSEKDMWKASAEAFFRIGMAEKAQQLMHKALACLPNREHVGLIVAFANLNNKYDHQEMGQTLLDQIVTSYPKRVDVWTQYVDMLIKSDLIDSARNVLERAIIQKIPLKKMRTIFKKYLEFEERYGDENGIQKVKALAAEYVKNNSHL